MGLREQVKRLEMQAVKASERELCPHEPPVINWPDGTVENESLHNCGKPRLCITLRYTDGSDQAMQDSAIEACERLRKKFDLPAEEAAEIIADTWKVLPETRAKLFEMAKTAS